MHASLAHSSALLGHLQRGRGAGFRAALAADPAVVLPLLVGCILQDPRWDRQLERRADYYARLAAQLHLPLAPLEDDLHSHTAEHAAASTDLPLLVLARMARRGHSAAAAVLVRYLGYVSDWPEAFDAIVSGDHAAEAIGALGSVVLARFPHDADLAAELDGRLTESPTWERWAAAAPQVAPLIAAVQARRPPLRPAEATVRAGIDPSWDGAALVAHATHETASIYGEVAGQRADVRDLPLLLAAFFGEDGARIRAATRALTILALSEALPPLLRFVEGFDATADARWNRYRIGQVRRILMATPGTLSSARAWLQASGWAQPSVALSILEAQAQEADVAPLRTLLMSALASEPSDAGAPYTVEGCLTALAPFAAQVPFDELARVFAGTRALWPRRGAAELMAAGHGATFTGTYAIECLWDCKDDIVELGCACADLALPLVRERLAHLAHSPYEDERVRHTAEERLRSSAATG